MNVNKMSFAIVQFLILIFVSGSALAADMLRPNSNQEYSTKKIPKPNVIKKTKKEIAPPTDGSGIQGIPGYYIFNTSLHTYTEILSGTLLGAGSIDDLSYNAINIGFIFHFNHNDFSQIGVNSNGFIRLGGDIFSGSCSYTPISSPDNTNCANILAPLAMDLQGNSEATLRTELLGVAPERVFVIQWHDFRSYAEIGDSYNFQIRLYETSNVIEFVYGPFIKNMKLQQPQVGLRGAHNQDFYNRTTALDWSNSTPGLTNEDRMLLTPEVLPPNGLLFSYLHIPSPDLSDSTFESPDLVTPNRPITYTIFIRNTGDSLAPSATLTNVIPAEFSFITGTLSCSSGSCTFDEQSKTVSWNGEIGSPGSPLPSVITLTYQLQVYEFECDLGNGAIVTNTVVLNDPAVISGPVILSVATVIWDTIRLTEYFEGSFPPQSWEITSSLTGTSWTNSDPGERGNLTGGSGSFAILDDDAAEPGSITDAELRTPPLDIPTCSDLLLSFRTDYNHFSNDYAAVDYSLDNGESWINLQLWQEDQRGPRLVQLPLPVELSGQSGVLFRFHYDDQGDYAWWWQVDDVQVKGCNRQGVFLRPETQTGVGYSGELMTYDLSLENCTPLTDTFEIKPNDFDFPTWIEPDHIVALPPGNFAGMTAYIQSWCDANGMDAILIQASGLGSGSKASALITTTANYTSSVAPFLLTNLPDFHVIEPPAQVTTRTLQIENVGSCPLVWELEEQHTEISWLTESITNGYLVTGAGVDVSMIYDSGELAPGDYTGTLQLISNDIISPLIELPVTITVQASVTFVYSDLENVVYPGEQIFLAGSFNDWNANSLPMFSDVEHEVFSTTLLLAPGQYQYQYVLENHWTWLNSAARTIIVSGDMQVEDYRNVVPGYTHILQPIDQMILLGDSVEPIEGEIDIPGLTNIPEQGRGILAQIGYGANPDPSNWFWVDALYLGENADNDIYAAVFTPTETGTYSYAVRFDGNWGNGNPYAGWTYGDSDGVYLGEPFEIANAGRLLVYTAADLIINQFDDPDPVFTGEVLTYSIIISNQGPSDAIQVILTDTIPAEALFLDASPGCTASDNVVVCVLGNLPNGSSIEMSIRIMAPLADGIFTNMVEALSITPETDPSNNHSLIVTTVIQPPLLTYKLYLPSIQKE